MNENKIFDRASCVWSLFVLLASWIYFYWGTQELVGSFFAAAMAAGLFWASYIMVRWVYLAFRK